MTEPTSTVAPTEDRREKSESARLRGDLARAEARAERAERALERMERSAKYTVGSLFVEAAKSPKRLLLLPRDLWRVWRLRKSRRSAAPSAINPRTRRDDVLDLEAARLLVPRRATTPAAAISIAGAISDSTALAWARHADVSRALPHDGAELVLAIDPDVVVIETAAAMPGQQWSYLGHPAAADRQLAAIRLIDAARANGRPVVLLRNSAPAETAFLTALEEQCDLVLDGTGARRYETWLPGIDLESWLGPLGTVQRRAAVLDPASAGDPLMGAGLGPSERVLARSMADALREQAIELSAPDPRLPIADGRRQALGNAAFAIASPLRTNPGIVGAAGSTLGALASGRRVTGTPDSDLARVLAEAYPAAYAEIGTDPLPELLERAMVPLDDTLHRSVLRGLLLRASAPAQLQSLAVRLGIAAHPAACWDVTVIVDEPDIDALLLQQWRPREVVVPSAIPDRARSALLDQGVRVVVAPPPTPRSREALTLMTSCPLVATQVDLSDPFSIADLLVEWIADLPPRARPTDAALWSRT